jgi:membrane fusion protein, multidrug efflux system
MQKAHTVPWEQLLAYAAALVLCIAVTSAFAQGAPPAPPVTVAPPLSKKITEWDEYTGRFEAVETIEVRARVSGFIDSVAFKDGQLVKKGDLLYTLDKRPYQIAVEAAKADINKAKAAIAFAENEVERVEPLIKSGAVTARDADQRRANLRQAQAQLEAAMAQLKSAELNLEWSEVRASAAGRISDTKVNAGNLVAGGTSGTTLLTTIVSIDPIRFVFDASEADYLRYSRQNKNGERTSSRDSANPVRVRIGDETGWDRVGKMDFVDNQINSRSGTIRGRAIFDNSDGFLTPGTFGRLRLFGGETEAFLVPDASIVSDQARKVIMTVGAEDKVVTKPVTLGPIVDGLRVIRSGISANDAVVIGGLANPFVRPGSKVVPTKGEIKPVALVQN